MKNTMFRPILVASALFSSFGAFANTSCSSIFNTEFTPKVAAPHVIAVSAPSGAGKTTLIGELRKIHPNSKVAISSTTRAPRNGEVNGVDYHFLTHAEFAAKVAAGEFIEYTSTYGNSYGTERREVEPALAAGQTVFVNVTADALPAYRSVYGELTVGVFIMPPSREVLKERLEKRALKTGETPEKIVQRLAGYDKEVLHKDKFDYTLVNGDLQLAVTTWDKLVRAEGLIP